MTEQGGFEARLADALRSFAAEAPVEVEALAFAQAVAREHPRRDRWAPLAMRSQRPALVSAIVGALLILGLLLAVVGVGTLLRDRDLAVDPARGFPVALLGEFEGNGPGSDSRGYYGMYRLDFAGPSLVRIHDAADGTAHARTGVWGSVEDWVGRAGAFVPTESGSSIDGSGDGEFEIFAPAPCGNARYRVDSSSLELRLSAISDSCPERVAILTRSAWSWVAADVVGGQRQHSFLFSEPFHFVPASNVGAKQVVSDGDLRFNAGPYWSIWLFDDVPVMVDVCDPSMGRLTDVPATPVAVGAWLRSSSRLTVANQTALMVDGRPALRFDTEASEACEGFGGLCAECGSGPREGAFQIGFLLYAIDTGDDTIIAVVQSEPAVEELEHAEAFAEGMARTMTFD